MDPWGHKITDAFGAQLREGLDVRPTIAITKVSAPCPDAPPRTTPFVRAESLIFQSIGTLCGGPCGGSKYEMRSALLRPRCAPAAAADRTAVLLQAHIQMLELVEAMEKGARRLGPGPAESQR
jgi:hypothetical protein